MARYRVPPAVPPASVSGFFAALRRHWFAAMSGTVSVPFGALAIFSDQAWQKLLWFLLAVVSVSYAAFKTWEDERTARVAERSELTVEVDSLKERLTPRFSITCGPDLGRCRVDHQHNGKRAIFLRAVATNTSEAPIFGCCAYLTSIRKDGVNLMVHESRRLPFTPGHEADAHMKTLPPNTPITIDVLVLTDKTTVLVATKEPYTFERRVDKTPVFSEEGTYVLSIVVCGQTGGAQEEKLVFAWTRDWNTSTMRLAGE